MQSLLMIKVLARKPGWKDSNFQVSKQIFSTHCMNANSCHENFFGLHINIYTSLLSKCILQVMKEISFEEHKIFCLPIKMCVVKVMKGKFFEAWNLKMYSSIQCKNTVLLKFCR